VDEKPWIQVLERSQGYIRLPSGRALTGFSHEYKRHGTATLFAAHDVMKGQAKVNYTRRRRRRQFLDFMNDVLQDVDANQEVHVALDNMSTHKPKNDRWIARHKYVHFHYTPTHTSWFNQIEIWFSILQAQCLRGGNFTSSRQLRNRINAFIESYNADAHPFEWRKVKARSKKLESKYSNLCR
jgi:transposase